MRCFGMQKMTAPVGTDHRKSMRVPYWKNTMAEKQTTLRRTLRRWYLWWEYQFRDPWDLDEAHRIAEEYLSLK